MSNKNFKNHNNYNKYYKKETTEATEATEAVEAAAETTEETTEDSVKDPIEKTVYTYTCGIVNCQKLNVRENPDINSKVIQIIEKGTEVSCYETKGDWVKVSIGLVYGYCMQKFIDLK